MIENLRRRCLLPIFEFLLSFQNPFHLSARLASISLIFTSGHAEANEIGQGSSISF
jgi:hypothetical protein